MADFCLSANGGQEYAEARYAREDGYARAEEKYKEDRWAEPYKQLPPAELADESCENDRLTSSSSPSRIHTPVATPIASSLRRVAVPKWVSVVGDSLIRFTAGVAILSAAACAASLIESQWLIGFACGFTAHLFAIVWLAIRSRPWVPRVASAA
ncbi:hypothetical protein VT84_37565 [Gemmata sp. SH-PL17]|nr:hypothetical protein VT84_37565 [Gemmata sp. SH-PL17]